HGTYFTRVKPANGLGALVEAVGKRAAAHPAAHGHWLIDGSGIAPAAPEGVAAVSYAALTSARAALQQRMQKIYEAAVFDPEAFRTRMAQTQPGEIGLDAGDAVL